MNRRIQKTALVFAAGTLALAVGAVWAGLWFDLTGSEKRAIKSRYTLWHSALRDRRFADAYAVMSPGYRQAHSLEEFSKDFESRGESWLALEQGCSARVYGTRARLYPFESGWFEFWNGPDYAWIKVGGEWFLTGRYEVYLD